MIIIKYTSRHGDAYDIKYDVIEEFDEDGKEKEGFKSVVQRLEESCHKESQPFSKVEIIEAGFVINKKTIRARQITEADLK